MLHADITYHWRKEKAVEKAAEKSTCRNKILKLFQAHRSTVVIDSEYERSRRGEYAILSQTVDRRLQSFVRSTEVTSAWHQPL